jgi:hypothetical protein
MRAPLSLLPLRLDAVEFAVGLRRIIRGISTTLEAGPRTVILGPNGAGKSVLLRLCHGLLEPTAGKVAWSAPELAGEPRRQAMVFQRPVLLRRTAFQRDRLQRKGTAPQRARDALRIPGLSPRRPTARARCRREQRGSRCTRLAPPEASSHRRLFDRRHPQIVAAMNGGTIDGTHNLAAAGDRDPVPAPGRSRGAPAGDFRELVSPRPPNFEETAGSPAVFSAVARRRRPAQARTASSPSPHDAD